MRIYIYGRKIVVFSVPPSATWRMHTRGFLLSESICGSPLSPPDARLRLRPRLSASLWLPATHTTHHAVPRVPTPRSIGVPLT